VRGEDVELTKDPPSSSISIRSRAVAARRRGACWRRPSGV
jgi:hypothetical protein